MARTGRKMPLFWRRKRHGFVLHAPSCTQPTHAPAKQSIPAMIAPPIMPPSAHPSKYRPPPPPHVIIVILCRLSAKVLYGLMGGSKVSRHSSWNLPYVALSAVYDGMLPPLPPLPPSVPPLLSRREYCYYRSCCCRCRRCTLGRWTVTCYLLCCASVSPSSERP